PRSRWPSTSPGTSPRSRRPPPPRPRPCPRPWRLRRGRLCARTPSVRCEGRRRARGRGRRRSPSRGSGGAACSATAEARAAPVAWARGAARALEIEETTRHDVVAYLSALEEQLGEPSRHVHFGMTSSDVVDTSFAALLVDAGEQLMRRLEELLEVTRAKA